MSWLYCHAISHPQHPGPPSQPNDRGQAEGWGSERCPLSASESQVSSTWNGSWLSATPLLPSFSSFSLFWLKCRLGSSEPELCIFRVGQTAPRGHCAALRPPHQQGWEDVLLEGPWKLCSHGWTSRPLGGHVAPASFPLPGHCVLALKGRRTMQVPKCHKPLILQPSWCQPVAGAVSSEPVQPGLVRRAGRRSLSETALWAAELTGREAVARNPQGPGSQRAQQRGREEWGAILPHHPLGHQEQGLLDPSLGSGFLTVTK